MLAILVSKFFPPPSFLSPPSYTRCARGHTRNALRYTHVRSRAIYHARSRDGPRLPPRRRDNEEDSSFHGNLRYTFMVAVRLYATSPGSEARNEKYHFNRASSPCYTLRWVSFPARYPANFAIPGWKKVEPLLTYSCKHDPDFWIFSSREDFA